MKRITSAHNEPLKHLARLLSQARARREHGQTVLEGVHLVQTCLQHGLMPQQLYLPESRLHQPEIQALLAQLPEHLITLAANEALAKITSLSEGEDVMALLAIPEAGALPVGGDCVVLERVQDPGNVGTILRSAAASGVEQIVLNADSADAWSPKVLRAGMGAHFLLRIHSRVDLAQWRSGYQEKLWATALSGRPQNLYAMALAEPAAWLFGNEGSGVSAAALALADGSVHIPMAGATESLNVAMAATVCLFEQMRQRMQAV